LIIKCRPPKMYKAKILAHIRSEDGWMKPASRQ
jgi:hypothetical protein